jgi:hypothetical protein
MWFYINVRDSVLRARAVGGPRTGTNHDKPPCRTDSRCHGRPWLSIACRDFYIRSGGESAEDKTYVEQ